MRGLTSLRANASAAGVSIAAPATAIATAGTAGNQPRIAASTPATIITVPSSTSTKYNAGFMCPNDLLTTDTACRC